ncbi:helix-turn-helix transcriptional regulator [Saccharopolyspora sp. 6V]|uniref:helix-turn-helix domain-containing protein n=1 Tax=Saccharopolyspora sp. 6V TaxID=2877239 RepID=UPI001CD75482|nr:helix-turn-helix transcriptional regulator [Saccharopolyspora sp. 6V]MCA1193449.1 helix-turn-helix domain-containing protein [Saccharopolyspora sp. 6V]
MDEMRSAADPGSTGRAPGGPEQDDRQQDGRQLDDRQLDDRQPRTEPSPMVRRHLLAGELRELRHAARLTHADVAQRLGWPQAKVSKIEGARQQVGVEAVIALADICHAGSDRRDRLVELAHSARGRGWWEAYRDVLPPDVRRHVGFEAEAVVVRAFAVEELPELVRTDEYAAAADDARAPERSSDAAERSLEVLRRRRRRVERGALALDLVLAESALRREVGGPEVLARQLDALRGLAELPTVAVRVLPFSAGALATGAPFSVLSFELDLPEVVVTSAAGATELADDPASAGAHHELLRRLAAAALPPEESVRWLRAEGSPAMSG